MILISDYFNNLEAVADKVEREVYHMNAEDFCGWCEYYDIDTETRKGKEDLHNWYKRMAEKFVQFDE